MTYRGTPRGIPNLPLTVQSVGCYDFDQTWREGPVRKEFLELFWTSSGQGAFTVGPDSITVGPGDLFIYRPGETHRLQATAEKWRYGWITLDHPDALRWVEGFGLTKRVQSVGPCPEDLLQQIAEQIQLCLPEGERRAAQLTHSLLITASAGPTIPKRSTPSMHAKERMDNHYHNPQFGVSEIADELNIHRTTLFRLFHQQFGLTPSRYLQNLRMQKALSMLKESNESIQDVARLCGYSDPNYFSRSVRRATGSNPRDFRCGQNSKTNPREMDEVQS
jgi:AraC-like DNA-binding protein